MCALNPSVLHSLTIPTLPWFRVHLFEIPGHSHQRGHSIKTRAVRNDHFCDTTESASKDHPPQFKAGDSLVAQRGYTPSDPTTLIKTWTLIMRLEKSKTMLPFGSSPGALAAEPQQGPAAVGFRGHGSVLERRMYGATEQQPMFGTAWRWPQVFCKWNRR